MVLNHIYWASTLCLWFILIVCLPPQTLQGCIMNFILKLSKTQGGYLRVRNLSFAKMESPALQNGLSKTGIYYLT